MMLFTPTFNYSAPCASKKKGPRGKSKSSDLTAANKNPPTPYIPLIICGNFFMCYFRFDIISYSQNDF